MKVKEIKFVDKDGAATPDKITVSMSIQEAIWIAKIAGQQRGESPHSSIYSAFTCDLFNRYWEDGVDDAIREFYVEIPPIVYPD